MRPPRGTNAHITGARPAGDASGAGCRLRKRANLLARTLDGHFSRQLGRVLKLHTGPRIDPAGLRSIDGLEVRGYLPDLHRHLTACDIAVVQGGLATTMELTAARRPFIYFPLGQHFEQQFHVAHRLDRHRSGRRMNATTTTPEDIASAIAAELSRQPDVLPVPAGGAKRAAVRIAELLA